MGRPDTKGDLERTSSPEPKEPSGSRVVEGKGAGRQPLSLLIAGIVVGAAVVAAFMLLVGLPLALTHRSNFPLEQKYGNVIVAIVSRLGAGSQSNPVAGNSRAIESGRVAYTGSCAPCHGTKGDGKGVFGLATYPPANDLTSGDAKEKSDAELFWITKNGLSFTGMPGFHDQYSDNEIWGLVSFIRVLQQGQSGALAVPTPTADQLAQADPTGNAVQRGAAVYFAQGCQMCHGVMSNAPGELALRQGGSEGTRAIRGGRPGMPAYNTQMITDTQLNDLMAYLGTFPAGRREGFPGREAQGTND